MSSFYCRLSAIRPELVQRQRRKAWRRWKFTIMQKIFSACMCQGKKLILFCHEMDRLSITDVYITIHLFLIVCHHFDRIGLNQFHLAIFSLSFHGNPHNEPMILL